MLPFSAGEFCACLITESWLLQNSGKENLLSLCYFLVMIASSKVYPLLKGLFGALGKHMAVGGDKDPSPKAD